MYRTVLAPIFAIGRGVFSWLPPVEPNLEVRALLPVNAG